MSPQSLIEETVANLLDNEAPLDAEFPEGGDAWREDLWRHWSDLGLAASSSPEELGGGGVTLPEACDILRVAARKAAPLPVAETDFMAGWVLTRCGEQIPEGPLAVASVDRHGAPIAVRRDGDRWKISGTAARVPWARVAHQIVVLVDDDSGPGIAIVDAATCSFETQPALSIEPRDDVVFDGATVEAVLRPEEELSRTDFGRRAALARAVQILGAMEAVLDLTVTYARDRRQFGRPISRFQAVQHQLAATARDVVLTRSAVELAIDAAANDPAGSAVPIAIGKAVASRRANSVASRGHQVHGAIGFTQEYRLHLFTTRLWEWRDEFGDERVWEQFVGRETWDARNLWAYVTRLEVTQ